MNMEREKTQRWESDPTVLLAEASPEDRELIGSWLESAGFRVLACPGPQAPGYVCVGGRTGWCPLIDPADAVLVDLRLASEDVMDGTGAAELLALYTSSGKPVVAFGPNPKIAKVFSLAVVVGPWPPEPYLLVRSVQDAPGFESSLTYERRGKVTAGSAEVFTFPWPGPGNSEGPVNPEGWVEVEALETPPEPSAGPVMALLATSPWPGPGDSEG